MIAQGIHLRFKKEGHRNAGGHRPGMSSGTASTTRRTKKNTNKSNVCAVCQPEQRSLCSQLDSIVMFWQ
jgi:hypothetical protein